jgi:hypothetical protein
MIRLEGQRGDPVKREALFKEMMGMDYRETVQALERYVRNGRYTWSKIKAPDIAPMDTYSVTPVEKFAIERRLADLELRVNRAP